MVRIKHNNRSLLFFIKKKKIGIKAENSRQANKPGIKCRSWLTYMGLYKVIYYLGRIFKKGMRIYVVKRARKPPLMGVGAVSNKHGKAPSTPREFQHILTRSSWGVPLKKRSSRGKVLHTREGSCWGHHFSYKGIKLSLIKLTAGLAGLRGMVEGGCFLSRPWQNFLFFAVPACGDCARFRKVVKVEGPWWWHGSPRGGGGGGYRRIGVVEDL